MSHSISIVTGGKKVGFEIQPTLDAYEYGLLSLDPQTSTLAGALDHGPSCTSWFIPAPEPSTVCETTVRRTADQVISVLGKFGVYAEIVD